MMTSEQFAKRIEKITGTSAEPKAARYYFSITTGNIKETMSKHTNDTEFPVVLTKDEFIKLESILSENVINNYSDTKKVYEFAASKGNKECQGILLKYFSNKEVTQ